MPARAGACPRILRILRVKADSLCKVLRGARDVTARLAYSVARLTDVSIDDLLQPRPPIKYSHPTAYTVGKAPDYRESREHI